MRQKQNLNFFDIADDIENLPENELFKLKGGNSDDDEIKWGVEGPEAQVDIYLPEKEEEEEEEREESYPVDIDEFDPTGEDWWENDGSDNNNEENQDKEEKEQKCTCELSKQQPSNLTPGISDPNNLLSSLKTFIAQQTTYLMRNGPDLESSGILKEAGIVRTLKTLDSISAMIRSVESSGKSFRIENGVVDGSDGQFYKDETGQYVIRLDTNGGYDEKSLLVHELYHAYQMTKGDIGFDDSGSATMVGMEDEIAAYQLQYNFESGAKEEPKIATEEGIKSEFPDAYTNIPQYGGSCPVHG